MGIYLVSFMQHKYNSMIILKTIFSGWSPWVVNLLLSFYYLRLLTIFTTLNCLLAAAVLMSWLRMLLVSLLSLIITCRDVLMIRMKGMKKPAVKRKML